MSDDPKNPDLSDATDDLEVGEEFAPTMALDLSDIPLGGDPSDEDEAEATTQMSAGDAQAFLARMEAERSGGGAASAEPIGRRTMVETPDSVRDVIAQAQAQARGASSGRPIAATVAESAVPVAESFRTGASPAAAPRPGTPAQGPHTAPNASVDGPATQPAPAIPRTMAASQVGAARPSTPPATTAQDDAVALVGQVSDPNTKLLLGLIVGVAVLLLGAVVGIVVLVIG